MLQFSDKKIAGTIEIKKDITEKEVWGIIVTAFEGGINYWCGHVEWDEEKYPKPEGEPISTFCTKLLLDGVTIQLFDAEEDDGMFELDLNKLLDGIAKNYLERPHDCDLENYDANTADCIIQYALFNEMVYG